MKHSLRAFRHPNFRLYFAGQSVSLIGTWVQTVAMSWMVYRLSESPFLLGLTGFAAQFPLLVLTPFIGTVVDRFDRKRLLLLSQVAAAVHGALLALLAWLHLLDAWDVIAFALLAGIIAAWDTPLRQSFVPEIVPAREDLGSAIAFSGFMQQCGRLIGPTVAGLMLIAWSETICFVVNAVSKVVVILAVIAMSVVSRPRPARGHGLIADLREGCAYAFGLAPLRVLLPAIALTSFMGSPYQQLLPIFAREVYGGGAETYGFLLGAAGLGGVASGLWLAGRPNLRGLARIVAIGCTGTGTALVLFAWSPWLVLSYALMFALGASLIMVITASGTLIQTIVEDGKRGRVMSIYTMFFLGMIPLGSLAGGAAAAAIGARYTVMIGGLCCLAGAVVVWRRLPQLRRDLREICARLGIRAE